VGAVGTASRAAGRRAPAHSDAEPVVGCDPSVAKGGQGVSDLATEARLPRGGLDLLETQLDVVYLAHPLKVRAIAEARIKTVRIDSRILTHLLRCDLVPAAYVRPKPQRPD
jgi:hypothetical protein